MSEASLVRTFPLNATKVNQSKSDKLTNIHRESVKTVRTQLRFLHRSVTDSGSLPKYLNTTGLPTDLPARYAAELSNTSLGLVRSWKSSLVSAALNALRKSSVRKVNGDDFYRLVYRLIAFGYGLGRPRSADEKVYAELDLTTDQKIEALLLCRQIVRHQRKHRRFSTFSARASITFGGKVVSVSDSVNTSFDVVVTFMGTERGKPIHAPVNIPSHTAAQLAQGFTMTDCVQICPQRDGSIRLRVVCKGVAEFPKLDPDVVIGIDVGAVNPVVTSMGDVFGNDFWKRVQHYDAQMIRAMKGVQQRNGAHGSRKHWSDSAGFRNATQRARDYVTNEIRRILNHLMELRAPSEIVVEYLENAFNDTNRKLTKRMRRLLRGVGRRVFTEKLESLRDETGVKVTEVNAAYTSKGCHCGSVDDKNRPTRDVFRCTRCGRKRSADVHASTMVRSRRSVSPLSRPLGGSAYIGNKRTALAHQRELTLLWCGERRTQPESSAGAGRELEAPAVLVS
jgi:IS605 OrfB family transposase